MIRAASFWEWGRRDGRRRTTDGGRQQYRLFTNDGDAGNILSCFRFSDCRGWVIPSLLHSIPAAEVCDPESFVSGQAAKADAMENCRWAQKNAPIYVSKEV
jgi:hypothetical protein